MSYLSILILFRWGWCCRSFILCTVSAVVGSKKVSALNACCSIYYVCYVSKYTLLLFLNYFTLFHSVLESGFIEFIKPNLLSRICSLAPTYLYFFNFFLLITEQYKTRHVLKINKDHRNLFFQCLTCNESITN